MCCSAAAFAAPPALASSFTTLAAATLALRARSSSASLAAADADCRDKARVAWRVVAMHSISAIQSLTLRRRLFVRVESTESGSPMRRYGILAPLRLSSPRTFGPPTDVVRSSTSRDLLDHSSAVLPGTSRAARRSACVTSGVIELPSSAASMVASRATRHMPGRVPPVA